MAESSPNSTRRSLFWRLWWRATLVRRPQAALALGSLLVAASITSLLLNLYSDVRHKMAQEFRAYGSNVVLAPASPPDGAGQQGLSSALLMDEASLRPLQAFEQRMPGLESASLLYGVVRLEPVSPQTADPRLPEFVNVVAVGADFATLRRIYPGWHVVGLHRRALDPGTCVLGARLAGRLRLSIGDTVKLQPSDMMSARQGRPPAVAAAAALPLPAAAWRVAGVLSTGAAEDEQVFVPLGELQSRLGLEGKLSLVELSVPGAPGEVERAMRELARLLPGVDVRPIRQIVYSEGKVLGTLRGLLLSLTVLILGIISICIMATMTAIVLERRRDIGVMKALGAGDAVIMRLFLAEGAGLGLLGGLVGFPVGGLLARGLGQRLFGVTLNWSAWTLPAVCGLTMLIAVAATAFPVRIVRGIQPSVVLKGE